VFKKFLNKRETTGNTSRLSKVIGSIVSVLGSIYIYMWNYCWNHFNDIPYRANLIPVKSGVLGGLQNKRGKCSEGIEVAGWAAWTLKGSGQPNLASRP
jgi:hypothetical protein